LLRLIGSLSAETIRNREEFWAGGDRTGPRRPFRAGREERLATLRPSGLLPSSRRSAGWDLPQWLRPQTSFGRPRSSTGYGLPSFATDWASSCAALSDQESIRVRDTFSLAGWEPFHLFPTSKQPRPVLGYRLSLVEHGFEVGMMHPLFVASAMHRVLGEARYRLCLVRRLRSLRSPLCHADAACRNGRP